MTGYVRKLFLEKGFAFIEGEDQRDYFLHWSKVLRSSVPFRNIKENDRVSFDFEEGPSGPKALNVLVIRGDQNGRREETGTQDGTREEDDEGKPGPGSNDLSQGPS